MSIEELVDKEITVEMNNLNHKRIGLLDSFNDIGIVLKKEEEKFFIPWRSIMDLRLRKDDDVETTHTLILDDSSRESFIGSTFFSLAIIVMTSLVTFIIYESFINENGLGVPRTIASAIGGPFIIIGFFGTFVAFLIGKTKTSLFMVILIFSGALLYIIYFGLV
ncbi:MAG: hypothetical protein ACYDAO_05420 [Thermoplasmataceae archaeon]